MLDDVMRKVLPVSQFQGFSWTCSPGFVWADQVDRASWAGSRCQSTRIGAHVFNRRLIFWGGSLPSMIPASRLTALWDAEGRSIHSISSLVGRALVQCASFCLERAKCWRHSSYGNQTVGKARTSKHRSDRTLELLEVVTSPSPCFLNLFKHLIRPVTNR